MKKKGCETQDQVMTIARQLSSDQDLNAIQKNAKYKKNHLVFTH